MMHMKKFWELIFFFINTCITLNCSFTSTNYTMGFRAFTNTWRTLNCSIVPTSEAVTWMPFLPDHSIYSSGLKTDRLHGWGEDWQGAWLDWRLAGYMVGLNCLCDWVSMSTHEWRSPECQLGVVPCFKVCDVEFHSAVVGTLGLQQKRCQAQYCVT